MRKLSVVIPALNEEDGIGDVLQEIPVTELMKQNYETEVTVVDNGSEDKTSQIARSKGAHVIVQPVRGYGNAYKAGFANVDGDIIATGDADKTYPFEILPQAVKMIEDEGYDFISTDRLTDLDPEAMEGSHVWGNKLLTMITHVLFGWPYHDSQSGMWIFKRRILDDIDLRSPGMPFSQELKIEAFVHGYKCTEVPIKYRARAGQVKLNTVKDGIGNVSSLIKKRIQISARPRTDSVGREQKHRFESSEEA